MFISFVVICTSCRKDPEIQSIKPFQELTLQDSVAGIYLGTREKLSEYISCPNCNPPCNFDYANQNDSIELQIVKHNSDSIEIIDLLDGIASRIIGIDSSLTYSGNPPLSAPYGHYNLEFKGSNKDTLILDLEYGGGNSCSANFTYSDYVLIKQ